MSPEITPEVERIAEVMSWSYVAGFFDGEGCIHYADRAYGRYVHMNVSQGVVNEANSRVLAGIWLFLRRHGVSVRWASYSGRTVNDKGGYKVIATNAPALVAWLTGMMPHLIVKRSAAESAVAFAASIGKRKLDKRVAA